MGRASTQLWRRTALVIPETFRPRNWPRSRCLVKNKLCCQPHLHSDRGNWPPRAAWEAMAKKTGQPPGAPCAPQHAAAGQAFKQRLWVSPWATRTPARAARPPPMPKATVPLGTRPVLVSLAPAPSWQQARASWGLLCQPLHCPARVGLLQEESQLLPHKGCLGEAEI